MSVGIIGVEVKTTVKQVRSYTKRFLTSLAKMNEVMDTC